MTTRDVGAHLGDHPSQGVQRLDAVVYDEDLATASQFLMRIAWASTFLRNGIR